MPFMNFSLLVHKKRGLNKRARYVTESVFMMIYVELYLQARSGTEMDKGMVGILVKPPWGLETPE